MRLLFGSQGPVSELASNVEFQTFFFFFFAGLCNLTKNLKRFTLWYQLYAHQVVRESSTLDVQN